MSTIKSSNEHLTLNADGSSKNIKFQANGVEKASISSAGAFTSTTIDATKLTGTIPNFTSTGIDDNADATAITISSAEQVGIGTASMEAPLHIKKFADTDTVETLLLLDCDKDSHRSGKGGSIVFQDISVYANTAEISAARVGGGSASEVKFKLRNTEILALRSDGRGLSQFTAKAWINFNGTGTIAIRDSHNVSSIQDGGTGDYDIFWDVNLANVNYCVTTGGNRAYSNNATNYATIIYTQAVGSTSIKTNNNDNTQLDHAVIMLQVFGD